MGFVEFGAVGDQHIFAIPKPIQCTRQLAVSIDTAAMGNDVRGAKLPLEHDFRWCVAVCILARPMAQW
jgi:hypothetical protein